MSIPPSGLGKEVTAGTIFRLLRPTYDYWNEKATRPSSGAFRKDGDIGISMVLKSAASARKIAEDPQWREYGVAEIDIHRLITEIPTPTMPPGSDPRRAPDWKITVHEDFDEAYWKEDHVLVVGVSKRLRDHVRDLAQVVRFSGPLRAPIDDPGPR